MRKTLTAIRLEPGQIERLEKAGARLDRSVSYLIRQAVEAFLKKLEGSKKK